MKLNVANKSCIRRIGFRHMKSAPARNIIAILAIALTSILFTAIFTIASSIVYSIEMSNFRQVGGYEHGGFKAITAEEVEILKDDPLIKQYGVRHFLGQAMKEPFNKSQVEISYKDAQEAAFSFIDPVEGRLPQEGTNEAATDTRVLSLLGVPAELGEEFTLTINVGGIETTETFILCGYWDYDEAIIANDVLLPDSRVNEILDKLGGSFPDGYTGMYFLDVMFQNSSNIEENLITVLENHGYEKGGNVVKRSEDSIFIPIGVNWGYLGAQFDDSADLLTAAALILVLLIIVFTGYLIIYNVFQISVSNDIRFYGLLKTIGTTGRQLKRIVLMQAFLLSVIGIPIGLLAGYGIGALMLPMVMEQTTLNNADLSTNPLIFIGSALFSLITVTISCRKPGKMAAKVSPIEAVRYSEGTSPHRKMRRTRKGASVVGMAFANLGRNTKRTVVTMLSLTLAVLLLNITFTFTNGFDMEKYVSLRCYTDFHIADASYYQAGYNWYSENMSVPESLIEQIQAQGGITDGGRTYADMSFSLSCTESVPEDHFRVNYAWNLAQMNSDAEQKAFIDNFRNENGQLIDYTKLYGMEPFCLEQLNVMDGDLSKLYEDGNYIAAVYYEDDYGNPILASHWAKVGDTVTIRYETVEWRDPDTGELIENPLDHMYEAIESTLDSHDVEYEVAATVSIPSTMTYRFYGNDEFVLNSETFKRDSGLDTVMYYAFDMEEDAIPAMEQFLTDYTNGAGSQFDFESRQKTIDDFSSMQSMFLFAGGTLSFIVGLIGVLNFLNTILTGILTRHREFAVLQSIGMTGKQLKEMLIAEGVCYAVLTLLLSFILIVVTAPFVASILNSTFWFFTYRFTALPAITVTPLFLLLGVLAPLITYLFTSGKSVVERLREAE